jgi:hypothetical protein
MSMDERSEEKEQFDTGTTYSSADDDQLQHSSTADEQSVKVSIGSRSSGLSGDHNLVRATVLTPSCVPSEVDERIIIELSSLMV